MNILPATLPGATIGTPYSVTMSVTGGIPPFAWSLTNNPSWLSINPSTGVLSGTPTGTSASTASFFVWVTDSETPTAVTANTGRSIAISVPILQITTTTLPSGTVNTLYSATVSATGGIPPYTWTLNTQPSWLSISTVNNNGVLSGTPTESGTVSGFTVGVYDSETPPQTAANPNLTITVNAAQACTGTLQNSLLNGSYALILNGWSSSTTAASWVGSFVADGNGNITNGLLDVADQSHSEPETGTFTGTYCVGSNNLATINITISGGPGGDSTPTFEASLDSVSNGISSNGHIIRYDTSGKLFSGLLRQQTTSAFSTESINGNYAFGEVGADPSGSRLASAGEVTANGSATLSGVYDANDAGTPQTDQTLTSTDFGVASTGRGTATITLSSGNLNYVFYVVSASEMLMMAVDTSTPPTILAGQVLQQSGTFTDASLNGVSVYETEGLDTKNTPATPDAVAGLLTTNGSGSLTVTLDENDGGTMSTESGSGTYSVASNGRVTVSVTGVNHLPVLYLIGQNQAFVVGTNKKADFGVMEPQSTPTGGFTNASLSGNYLGGSQQPVNSNVKEDIDYVNADGVGTVTGTQDENGSGGPSSGSISGTYVVSSNGRVVVSQGVAQEVIIYMISTSQFVALGTQGSNPKLTDFHQ
jgi:hypothetical protein